MKRLEKLDDRSEGRKRKKEGSKNMKESSKRIKKKEQELLVKKTKKISEYFAFKPNKKVAYLEEGSVKENCALSGTARAPRPTSPPSRPSSSTSLPSTARQEQLLPSENSTLCAHYRQRTADFCKREDDSVSRPTNVCGPITASRLANRGKVWEMSEY
jgi:hypothetical protein